ncbi:phytanoyl-CoA dioxygenase family protein [Nitrospirillum sp. BR 11752]|uniref:phytanoyl-CoA dioxygenase family protein n=1 Tax=Nitrospirillum sp. BR 11752 TaxID=3104293 RepID=UPI002ECA6F3F|nr:phytanoyl-CoA dioxygenase family protein [Nitrospirillum sp. BR 11752]
MSLRNEYRNPLPGVPVVESPFFERLFMAQDPTPEEVRIAQDLREKGYAVVDFPEPEFDRLATEIREELSGQYDWQAWRAGQIPSLRIQDAWETNANVRRIAANQHVLKLLERLYGRRAFPFQTLNFAVGTQQHVHSDSVHFSSIPERFMCGVWVALEDIDMDNGPLMYYPGSHKWPLYLNEHIGVNSQHLNRQFAQYGDYEYLWRELISVHDVKPEIFLAKKGQALIWSANLLHAGGKQNDLNRTRYSQVTHYYFDDCSYYTPLASDPFYGNIYFRNLMDISQGGQVANKICGHEVPEAFIKVTVPGKTARSTKLPADFDPEAYLALNPDVKAANVEPAEHYLNHGQREGRRWR